MEPSPNSWRLRASHSIVISGCRSQNCCAVASQGASPRSCFQVMPRRVFGLPCIFCDYSVAGKSFNVVLGIPDLLKDLSTVFAEERWSLYARWRTAEFDWWPNGPKLFDLRVIETDYRLVMLDLRVTLHCGKIVDRCCPDVRLQEDLH